MATKRKTGGTTGKTTKKAQSPKTSPAADMDRRWGFLFFGFGVLVLLLCVMKGQEYSAWGWIRSNILFGTFGVSSWLVGPLLLYWAVLVAAGKPIYGAFIKGALVLLCTSAIAVLFSSLNLTAYTFAEAVAQLHEGGTSRFWSGGVLGVVLGYPLLLLGGRPLANVLIVVLALLALMYFTGFTPADLAAVLRSRWQNRPRREQPARAAVVAAQPTDEAVYAREDMLPAYEELPIEPEQHYMPTASSHRIRRKLVDVDLGPDLMQEDAATYPDFEAGFAALRAPAAPEAPDDDYILEPFDPYSPQSLFEPEPHMRPAEGALLFGEDDPFAQGKRDPAPLPGHSAGVGGNPPAVVQTPAAIPTDDEFSFEMEMAAAGAREQKPGSAPVMAGEPVGVTAGDPTVDALIARAADKKDEGSMPAADNRPTVAPYQYPPLSLFEETRDEDDLGARDEMHRTADLLVSTLSSFGVQTRILDVSRGPAVTRYEVQPQTGVKISRITSLADDIALNLAAGGVRIEAPIPGKPAVGIEVPNRIKSVVSIRSILESRTFVGNKSALGFALGKDIAGESVVADLTRMPHLLVAGSTGSGKSVCINSIIMSFLFKSSPEDVRLVLIDPKVVELAEYNGIPHLLTPVVTEPRKAAGALGAMVAEMDKRYKMFAEYSVRDIKSFNEKAARRVDMDKLPYIAVIIDELADLMMTSGKEVEDYICRLAQKARACGIHLIVATQRPSVDVITGLIKSNIPSRIAFAVSSQVDSRTILDGAGAEKLLGMGDMLFMPVGANKPLRVQGTYVKDKEITAVLRYIKQNSDAQYDEDLMLEMEKHASQEAGATGGDASDLSDPTFVAAVELALDKGDISTSYLQTRLRVGYARARRLVDEMEQMGIIGEANGAKPREVLITRSQWMEMTVTGAD